jgi:hypothetical protein
MVQPLCMQIKCDKTIGFYDAIIMIIKNIHLMIPREGNTFYYESYHQVIKYNTKGIDANKHTKSNNQEGKQSNQLFKSRKTKSNTREGNNFQNLIWAPLFL